MHPSHPIAGFYLVRLAAGAVWCPVHIWHGPPPDPVTGELLDRSPRWQAMVRGEQYEGNILELWLRCAGHWISEADYHYQVAVHHHATEHEPEMPEAAPKSKINHHTMKPIF